MSDYLDELSYSRFEQVIRIAFEEAVKLGIMDRQNFVFVSPYYGTLLMSVFREIRELYFLCH